MSSSTPARFIFKHDGIVIQKLRAWLPHSPHSHSKKPLTIKGLQISWSTSNKKQTRSLSPPFFVTALLPLNVKQVTLCHFGKSLKDRPTLWAPSSTWMHSHLRTSARNILVGMDKNYQVTKRELFLKINYKINPQTSLRVLGVIMVKRIDVSSEKLRWNTETVVQIPAHTKVLRKKLLSADTEHDQILFAWYKLPSI